MPRRLVGSYRYPRVEKRSRSRSARAGHRARTSPSEIELRLSEWPWAEAFAEPCKRALRLHGRPLPSRGRLLEAQIRGPCKREPRLPSCPLPSGVEIQGQGGEQDLDRRSQGGHSRGRRRSHILLSPMPPFPPFILLPFFAAATPPSTAATPKPTAQFLTRCRM